MRLVCNTYIGAVDGTCGRASARNQDRRTNVRARLAGHGEGAERGRYEANDAGESHLGAMRVWWPER
jgi:hypothetical protein